jgi:hypothetical protein
MRSKFVTVPFCLFLAPALWADDGKLKRVDKPPTACHGTAVEFVDNAVEAAQLAKKEKKLVLVLHVSGYFEDPNFT